MLFPRFVLSTDPPNVAQITLSTGQSFGFEVTPDMTVDTFFALLADHGCNPAHPDFQAFVAGLGWLESQGKHISDLLTDSSLLAAYLAAEFTPISFGGAA